MTNDQLADDESPAAGSPPDGQHGSTYARLLRYVLRYRTRLAIILFLSVVVAASLSTMILTVGSAIKIIYADDSNAEVQIAEAMERARTISETLERSVGWSPPRLDERVESVMRSMRDDPGRALRLMAGALVMLSVLGSVARFFQEYYSGTIGINVSMQLNKEMFANVMNLSHSFYDRRSTGEIVTRFTNDAFLVHTGLMDVFKILFREPIKIVFFLAVALNVNAFLTLMVLLVLIPLALIITAISKGVKSLTEKTLKRFAAIVSIITESIRGVSVVKGFQMEEHETARAVGEFERLRRYQKQLTRARAAVSPVTEVLMVLGLGVFLWVSAELFSNGEGGATRLGGGDAIMLFGALAAMLDPLKKLSNVANSVQISVASAARVFEFIDSKPEIADRPGAVTIKPLQEALRFEHVDFSYDGDTQVLHDVSFEVKVGEMVALVGFSGSGKSTLAKLVPRFYEPTKGRVSLDGVDIRDATIESLRGQISVVSQETVLFAESVHANIAYGQLGVSEERVREAARAANATEFVEALPGSYDASLEESGGNLSGGQRQRLAIARAIVKDPAILILDEATSSLDSESEAAVLSAIDQFVVGRTTLVIAHRLSTVQKADRIVVLDSGCVVEQGTHAELLATGGIYQRLYRLQFAAHADSDGSLESGNPA